MSVCIPTINRPEYLGQAIASVAAQTYQDFQILIADNSADPTCHRRIDEIIARHSGLNIALHRHDRQLDAVDNFNSLIDAARGEFWVCLPDDDVLCPTALARAVEALDRHPECGFTFADHWVMSADGIIDRRASAQNSIDFGRHLLKEGVYRHESIFGIALKQSICLQTMMLRRPLIASLRFLPGIVMSDLSLTLRIGVSEQPIHAYYIAEQVFSYRVHGQQLTTEMKRKALLQSYIAALETPLHIPPAHIDEYRSKLARQYLSLAVMEAQERELAAARSHARESFRLDPGLRTALGTALVTGFPFLVPWARRFDGLARRLTGRKTAASS